MDHLDKLTAQYFKNLYEVDMTLPEVYLQMKDTRSFQFKKLEYAVSEFVDEVMKVPPFVWVKSLSDWLERKGW